MVLINSPRSPSDTRCEQRLTRDGKKTPIRQVYGFISAHSAGVSCFAESVRGVKNGKAGLPLRRSWPEAAIFGQVHFPRVTAFPLCDKIGMI